MSHSSREIVSLWIDGFPPSDNRRKRWRTAAEKEFYELVASARKRFNIPSLSEPVNCRASLFAPDHRVRDGSNYLKCLCDSLQFSGILENDSLIVQTEVTLFSKKEISQWTDLPLVLSGGTFVQLFSAIPAYRKESLVSICSKLRKLK